MRLVGAELVESREILPGTWLQAWHAPAIVSGARAGQYVHVRTTEAGGLPLRRPYPIATTDAASGILTIQAPGAPAARRLAGALRPGDIADIAGPLGRPFEVDPRSRHLLLVAEGPAIASRCGCSSTRRSATAARSSCSTAPGRRPQVYPSSLLPDEVEYVVATADGSLGHRGRCSTLVQRLRGVGRPGVRGGVAGAARRGRGDSPPAGAGGSASRRSGASGAAAGPSPPGSPEARRKAFLQVLVEPVDRLRGGDVPGVRGHGRRGGPERACREGPVFAADELDWGADDGPWPREAEAPGVPAKLAAHADRPTGQARDPPGAPRRRTGRRAGTGRPGPVGPSRRRRRRRRRARRHRRPTRRPRGGPGPRPRARQPGDRRGGSVRLRRGGRGPRGPGAPRRHRDPRARALKAARRAPGAADRGACPAGLLLGDRAPEPRAGPGPGAVRDDLGHAGRCP